MIALLAFVAGAAWAAPPGPLRLEAFTASGELAFEVRFEPSRKGRPCKIEGRALEAKACQRLEGLASKAMRETPPKMVPRIADQYRYRLSDQKKSLAVAPRSREECRVLPDGKLACRELDLKASERLLLELLRLAPNAAPPGSRRMPMPRKGGG